MTNHDITVSICKCNSRVPQAYLKMGKQQLLFMTQSHCIASEIILNTEVFLSLFALLTASGQWMVCMGKKSTFRTFFIISPFIVSQYNDKRMFTVLETYSFKSCLIFLSWTFISLNQDPAIYIYIYKWSHVC